MTVTIANKNTTNNSVTGSVRTLLRAEDLFVIALALVLYARSDASWGRFAAWFLFPDLSMIGYLIGARAGAVAYNTLHSLIGPLALGAAAALGWAPSSLLPLACIWGAHVGFDRALGYGLKYATAFGHTHLGTIGRLAAKATARATAAVAV